MLKTALLSLSAITGLEGLIANLLVKKHDDLKEEKEPSLARGKDSKAPLCESAKQGAHKKQTKKPDDKANEIDNVEGAQGPSWEEASSWLRCVKLGQEPSRGLSKEDIEPALKDRDNDFDEKDK